MDQRKIGKFIAECRRKEGLTQMLLSEKLGITDKAVSKWERGIAMPDPSIMLPLCEILGISVNELLRGERIHMENKQKQQEELLLELAADIEYKNRAIWAAMWAILTVCMLGILAGCAVAAFVIPEGVWQPIAALGTVAVFLPPCFYALKLEVSVGTYKCRRCGHEHVPTYTAALMAMHLGTTRYLKCPSCGKRSWCKKVIKP